jgi:hypothetical protein
MPLSKIPSEIQVNVTILCMAHLCCRLFQGHTEQGLPTTFLDEYKRLMKWEQFSIAHIAQKIILPGLMNKIDTFPTSFKELLLKYSEGLKAGT